MWCIARARSSLGTSIGEFATLANLAGRWIDRPLATVGLITHTRVSSQLENSHDDSGPSPFMAPLLSCCGQNTKGSNVSAVTNRPSLELITASHGLLPIRPSATRCEPPAANIPTFLRFFHRVVRFTALLVRSSAAISRAAQYQCSSCLPSGWTLLRWLALTNCRRYCTPPVRPRPGARPSVLSASSYFFSQV